MSRKRDDRTLSLFEIPKPAASLPASMDYRLLVSGLVSELLREADADRYEIAARMSRLSGRDVSKYMLDAYASGAREEFNLPFCQVPVLEAACDSHLLTTWLIEIRGGRAAFGREALNAELGRLERQRDDAARKIRELKKVMGERE